MIKDFTPRLYQETIFGTAVNHNTLVVLPTGMGKTNVFLMLAAQRLKQHPNSKILLVGPTRPLIEQYYEVFTKYFAIEKEKMAVLTGFVPPAKRAEIWKSSSIIFSTPQGLENDIINSKISLEEVSLLGVDEAHRAVGDYSYVWLAKQYRKKAKFPRIIALTASPGSDVEKIEEVCRNLGIEKVEVRTEQDPDVKQYVQDIQMDFLKVDLTPEIIEIKKFLSDCIKSKLNEVKKYGFLKPPYGTGKKDLLQLQGALHGMIARGEKDFPVLKSISLLAETIKASHALELLETQSISALHNYFEKLAKEAEHSKVKAVKNLVADLNFRSARIQAEKLYEKGIEHPKMYEVRRLAEEEVKRDNKVKIIVFTQYRDTAVRVKQELSVIKGAEAEIFVGQMKRGETGMSQKQQKEMLERFRSGEFNTLIATSIGEEGLDIPKVDLVIFYEAIPSAIRQIQRRGRTGRQEKGRVIMLMAANTRDEAFRWVSQRKEKKMHSILSSLKSRLKLEKQAPLKKFDEDEKVKIFGDFREKGSGVIKELIEQNAEIEMRQLNVGDYLCSSRVAIEVKTIPDFVNSIIDGRLLSQVKELKYNFEKPVVVIEGEEDIYSVRNVHPNAIRGMLATIAVDYGIPILKTKDYRDTAALLLAIAKREQKEDKKDFSLRGEKKPMSEAELQEYIVASLPGVESVIAKGLLKEFKTIKNIVDAPEEELKKAEKIGAKKAADIRKILDREYEG
ncbi:DEAD/DEAH box helicase [Candidatus Woesearchaeota archaeon]|nr:DEAD/DEAH box helicase [Candidatus Woesearchaeota archaeon]